MPVSFAFHDKKNAIVVPSWPTSQCFCSRKPSPAVTPAVRRDWSREGAALLQLPKQGAEIVGTHISSLLSQFGLFNVDEAATSAKYLTEHATLVTMPLSIVVFGATGDLARKKLFPALYQLCVLGLLPRDLRIVAVSRKESDREEFLDKQCVNVREDARMSKDDFCARITLHAGGYDTPDAFASLAKLLQAHESAEHGALGEGLHGGNRLFILAVPPTCFGSICSLVDTYCRAPADSGGFTRVMVEKPFGRDSPSFAALHALTSRHFSAEEIYRLDHYLGKEVILNIPSLRWANQLFEPTWNASHIECVQITFKEDLGTGGRGGFFDREGIIRDVMQNHLLQVMALVAMEQPLAFTAEHIMAEKLKVLQACEPITKEDIVVGQYVR